MDNALKNGNSKLIFFNAVVSPTIRFFFKRICKGSMNKRCNKDNVGLELECIDFVLRSP